MSKHRDSLLRSLLLLVVLLAMCPASARADCVQNPPNPCQIQNVSSGGVVIYQGDLAPNDCEAEAFRRCGECDCGPCTWMFWNDGWYCILPSAGCCYCCMCTACG